MINRKKCYSKYFITQLSNVISMLSYLQVVHLSPECPNVQLHIGRSFSMLHVPLFLQLYRIHISMEYDIKSR